MSTTDEPKYMMLGLYFVSIGMYSTLLIFWTLSTLNLPPPLQKAISLGSTIGIGNFAGFVSAWIYHTSRALYKKIIQSINPHDIDPAM